MSQHDTPPDTLLLRVLRVAEILARGEGDTSTAADRGRKGQPVATVEQVRQKTQVERFQVS